MLYYRAKRGILRHRRRTGDQNFADFRKKVTLDKEFARKFAEVRTPEDLVRLAAAEGYTFTVEDIRNNTDVTPEELEKSSGGGFINVTGKVLDDPGDSTFELERLFERRFGEQ